MILKELNITHGVRDLFVDDKDNTELLTEEFQRKGEIPLFFVKAIKKWDDKVRKERNLRITKLVNLVIPNSSLPRDLLVSVSPGGRRKIVMMY